VALVTLAVAIGFSIWGQNVLRLICTLFAVVVGASGDRGPEELCEGHLGNRARFAARGDQAKIKLWFND
jgi:hypothetical protein